MIGIPIEIWEENTGVSFLRKEILPDSGGAGEHQGGAGQLIELRNDTGRPVDATFFGSRTSLPSRGFKGGRDGAIRTLFVNGKPVAPKARMDVAPGRCRLASRGRRRRLRPARAAPARAHPPRLGERPDRRRLRATLVPGAVRAAVRGPRPAFRARTNRNASGRSRREHWKPVATSAGSRSRSTST